jgi:hypothetical protein
MKTVRETKTFKRQADKIWSEEERLEFISYLASDPTVGDVRPKAEGARKVRWTVKGSDKSSGVRVIYKKADKENMRPNEIKEVL